MGVSSDGNKYGIPEGLFFSFPCKVKDGSYSIVNGIDMNDETTQRHIKQTTKELLRERSKVEHLLR